MFFLVFALDVALVATRPGLRRFAPVIVVGNALWVVASVIAVVAGAWDLTTLGVAFVLAQAGRLRCSRSSKREVCGRRELRAARGCAVRCPPSRSESTSEGATLR